MTHRSTSKLSPGLTSEPRSKMSQVAPGVACCPLRTVGTISQYTKVSPGGGTVHRATGRVDAGLTGVRTAVPPFLLQASPLGVATGAASIAEAIVSAGPARGVDMCCVASEHATVASACQASPRGVGDTAERDHGDHQEPGGQAGGASAATVSR